MASATTLSQAAGQSFDNLFALWAGVPTALKSALVQFSSSVLSIFPESDQVGHPLADWGIVIASLSRQPTSSFRPPQEFLTVAVDYVYRICWLGAKPTASAPSITETQRSALLAAYNASF